MQSVRPNVKEAQTAPIIIEARITIINNTIKCGIFSKKCGTAPSKCVKKCGNSAVKYQICVVKIYQ